MSKIPKKNKKNKISPSLVTCGLQIPALLEGVAGHTGKDSFFPKLSFSPMRN